MKKIAFLFLIYDIINHEDLWKTFFDKADKTQYNIYIHYKNNKSLKYFENYKLVNCIQTEYADISIVKAQTILLEEALKDENNQHFIFLSNSCIPLKSFQHVYDNLDISKSYFNISPQEQCFPNCNDLLKTLDRKFIQKASQWCILNRKHSYTVINDKKYLDLYSKIYSPDEIYFITTLFKNNLQNEIISTLNMADKATTFTNWEGMNYKFPSDKGLKNYNCISKEELFYLLNSKCFFWKKI